MNGSRHSRSAPRLLAGSLLLWLPLLLVSDAPPRPGWVAPPRWTELPPEPVECSLSPALEVVVDGTPIRCGFDTGQEVALLLEPHAARRAGLRAEGRLTLGDGSPQGRRSVQRTWVEQIRLGGARFSGVPAAVLSTPLHADGIEGTVGYSLLRHCAFELDLRAGVLRLMPSGARRPDAHALPLDDSSGLPRIMVGLEGRELPAIVDSGNRAGLLVPHALADELSLPIGPDGEVRLRTLFATHEARAGVLPSPLEVGRFHLRPIAFLANRELPSLNLGTEILARFRLRVDPLRREVHLQPAEPDRWRPHRR